MILGLKLVFGLGMTKKYSLTNSTNGSSSERGLIVNWAYSENLRPGGRPSITSGSTPGGPDKKIKRAENCRSDYDHWLLDDQLKTGAMPSRTARSRHRYDVRSDGCAGVRIATASRTASAPAATSGQSYEEPEDNEAGRG